MVHGQRNSRPLGGLELERQPARDVIQGGLQPFVHGVCFQGVWLVSRSGDARGSYDLPREPLFPAI